MWFPIWLHDDGSGLRLDGGPCAIDFLWLCLSAVHVPFSLFRHGVLIWWDCFSVVVRYNSWESSMRAKQFCILPIPESEARLWCRWTLGTPMAQAAVRSMAAVLLLFIHCLLLPPLFVGVGVCAWPSFSYAVLSVLSSFAIIIGKRELIALL